jgi:hypothetical protein
VLGRSWVGVAGQDLGVSERDACVEGVGDGGVPQGVRADVPWNAGDRGDPGDHPVRVATVDGLLRNGSQDEGSGGALAAAGFQDAEDGHGDRHGGGLVALPDQVQHLMASESLGVILDPHG